MTTVEIKEKQPTDTTNIDEITESTDKENNKKLDDENEALKLDLRKKTDVIGDGPKNDKIFNNVSCAVSLCSVKCCCLLIESIVVKPCLSI